MLAEEPEDTALSAQRKEILMKMALSKEPRLMPQWEEGKERDRSKGILDDFCHLDGLRGGFSWGHMGSRRIMAHLSRIPASKA